MTAIFLCALLDRVIELQRSADAGPLPWSLVPERATGLAVLLGFPDGIWGSAVFFAWLGAVAAVALASTLAAALMQTAAPPSLR